jgi:hypothetical protein
MGGIGGEQDRLAHRHTERAEAAFMRAQDPVGCLVALGDLAVHAAEAGDEANVRYALAKAEQLDPDVAAWWQSYTAGVSTMGSDPDAAATAFRRCLETVEVLPQSVEHWRRQCALKLAFLTGDELGPLGDTPRDRLMELVRGAASADGADEERALRAVEAAERSRLKIRSEAKQRELSATLDLFYTAAAAIADRSGRYRDALDFLELNTSRSLVSRGTTSWLWQRATLGSSEIQKRTNVELLQSLTRWERTGGSGEWQRLETALRRRQEAAYEVEEELVRHVPPPHRIFLPETTSTLEPRLSTDDAVVFFASFGPVYVVRDGRVDRAAEVRPEEIETAAGAFARIAAIPGRTMPDAEVEGAAAELLTTCVDPLREALAGARRVFVVPSEALWGVPLATLGAAPLAESHEVTYVPSLSVVAWLVTQEQDRPRRRVERFVGVADPDGTLPYAAEEVTAAASHFYDSTVLVGDDIKVGDALLYVVDADVVHLACHAGFFAEFPDLSYIHLAGRGDARAMIWARDLARLRMRPRLVVLAACHAGTSVALPGNEYVGLPAAFLGAGALTVVAPLWAVDDRSTARFMAAFYDELDEASPSVALRRTQLRLQDEPGTAHPYYWAGFQAFGVP